MNETDTTRILSQDALAAAEDGSPAADDCDRPEEKPTNAATTTTCCGWRVPRCPVTVEPVMFLAMFSVILQGPLSTQYLYDRMSEEVGFNSSRTSRCDGNGSVPPDSLLKVAWLPFCSCMQIIITLISKLHPVNLAHNIANISHNQKPCYQFNT